MHDNERLCKENCQPTHSNKQWTNTHWRKAKQKISCMKCNVYFTMYNKLCKENSQHPHILTVSNLRKWKSESEAPQREVAKS